MRRRASADVPSYVPLFGVIDFQQKGLLHITTALSATDLPTCAPQVILNLGMSLVSIREFWELRIPNLVAS